MPRQQNGFFAAGAGDRAAGWVPDMIGADRTLGKCVAVT
jgi:hypothetical protein